MSWNPYSAYQPNWQTLDQVKAGGQPLYVPPPNPTPTPGLGKQPPKAFPNWFSGQPSGSGSRGAASGVGGNGTAAPQIAPRSGPPMPNAPNLPSMPGGFTPTGGNIGSYQAPDAVGDWQAPDYGRVQSAIDKLGGKVNIGGQGRIGLGGPEAFNDFENIALEGLKKGFDPGTGQFVGKELSDEVFSDADTNQLAQREAAAAIRANQDAEEAYAQEAGRGGSFDPNKYAMLKARGRLGNAAAISSATRDATLDAKRANAAQAIAARENSRQNFNTDLNARLGLGRLGLDTSTEAGTLGQNLRGLNQARDISRYTGQITQRGQDLTRSQAEAELNSGRDIAAANASLGLTGQQGSQSLAARGQDIDQMLGRGRLGLEARGQDIGLAENQGQQGLQARGQDIEAGLGIGRLANDQYSTQAGIYNSGQERAARVDEINAQLQNANLDRNTRNALEEERLQLTRDTADLSNQQFQQSIGENQRQYDTTQGFNQQQANIRNGQFAAGQSANSMANLQNILSRSDGFQNMSPYQQYQFLQNIMNGFGAMGGPGTNSPWMWGAAA